jgi:hypothetical protein
MTHFSHLCRISATVLPVLAVAAAGGVLATHAGSAPLGAGLSGEVAICKGTDGRLARSPALLAMAGQIILADSTTGSADAEDNLDLFEKLGLMEGHLVIGKALLDAGMQSDALPHFGHPVRELYDYLKPVFADRRYPEFQAELIDLEQRAKSAPKDPATTTAYDDVIAKIDGLRRTIPNELLSSPDFITDGIALMVEDAAGDLGESLDKGRIVNVVEYHDAMGFARYADGAVRRYGSVLGARAGAIARETKFTLSAFPSLTPPGRPTHSVSDLRAAAARVKAAAQPRPKAG